MSSVAILTFDLRVPPTTAAAAVHRVVVDGKHRLLESADHVARAHDECTDPSAIKVDFATRKTMLNWELAAEATITPSPAGSQVRLSLDVMPGRPKALLDGKKNEKAARKLADQIRAAAG
ncbi:hypothetical protein [Nocardioides lijunqiniae]|uniref:hypothetical protein n=1 Tax=Nocardioides lijunqiniae TaxID=2760832 RepID=UPI0018775498|nr:hypothetical protein [Nocardioides lijunqiniae]